MEDQSGIVNVVAEYYGSLFGSDETCPAAQHEMLDCFDKTLCDRSRALLDVPLSLGELHRAMLSMKKDKSPGLDGLPVAFYSMFWDDIGECLLTALQECASRKSMTATQSASVMRLVHKKGARSPLSSWPPIALSCVDY